MDQQKLLATLLWMITLLVLLLLAFTWSRRHAPAGKAITIALLSMAVYSAGYAVQITAVELADIRFWIKVQYIGIVALPQLWLLICMQYTNRHYRKLNPLANSIFWGIPFLFLLLVFSEHPLHYADIRHISFGALTLPVAKPGIALILFSIYSNLLLLAGGVLLVLQLKRAARPMRKPGWLMLIGATVFWLSYLANNLGLGPSGLDLAPFGLGIAATIWAIAVFNQHLLNIRPMALEMLFESMPAGVILLDTQQRIIEYNPAATLILPKLATTEIGQDLSMVLADDYSQLSSFITDTQASQLALHIDHAKGSSHYHCTKHPLVKKDKMLGTCLVLRDDTSEELLRQQMQLEVSQDYLTEAYTRRALADKGTSYLATAQQNGEPLAVIMIDLDNYKGVNDTHGHLVGDRILQHTVAELQAHLPPDALLVRYGGDEFVALVPKMALPQARDLAEKLCATVRRDRFHTSVGDIHITLSCGVAQMQSRDDSLASLIELADQAVYEAKEAGGDCVRCA